MTTPARGTPEYYLRIDVGRRIEGMLGIIADQRGVIERLEREVEGLHRERGEWLERISAAEAKTGEVITECEKKLATMESRFRAMHDWATKTFVAQSSPDKPKERNGCSP